MNRKNRQISAILFLILLSSPLAAREYHFRIRTIAGMEPIGMLTVRGLGNAEDSWNTGYGFSPGLEIYYILNSRIDIGAGFKWQLSRRVFRETGSIDESFSFIPLYVTTRIRLSEVERFTTYLMVKLGYAFFQSTQDFRNIWNTEPGGALNSTSGGIFASAVLGIILNLKEFQNWALDLSMDAGYAYSAATGRNISESYPISYQAMTVDMALDWRF